MPPVAEPTLIPLALAAAIAEPQMLPKSRGASLTTTIAGARQRRLAGAAIASSLIAFVIVAPFARQPLAEIPAFVPAYTSAAAVIDLLTTVLLFGQFVQQRSAALLALAAGYLFAGLMVVAHALSFPGLIVAGDMLGDGSQATAWLYLFWTGGYPIFVIAYAGLLQRAPVEAAGHRPGRWLAAWTAAAVVTVAIALTLLAIDNRDLLPQIVTANGYAPAEASAAGVVCALGVVALLMLVRRRPYSVLALWLIVAIVAWLCDIGLSSLLNSRRFDLGFYIGRGYGLLATSFVLGVLLFEVSELQRRLALSAAQLHDHARDLDDRVRQRTQELVRTNRQLTAILRASPLGIMMLSRDGIVRLWNSSAARVFGYSEAEALGRLPPYLTDENMTNFQQNLARADFDPAASGFHELQRRRKDGAIIDLAVNWARVNDEAGQMLGIMYAVADITETKKLERQLHQAQKMEAVGTLAGGMAHDFNNLLGVVILNLDVLRDRLGQDPEADELTQEAMTAALRGAELIRRLLAFARRQPLQPQHTEVNRLVGEITKLLERTLGEDITITLRLGDGVWQSVVDPAQLEASLANLATNARDAMPNGGRLAIATGNRHLDADYASQHAEVTPGDYAMIEVSDSGNGMPPEVLGQAFEPFFTTKGPGKGTGLGLSMVYGFIKQSGGHVNIYSEVGVGTTVRLYLPRADADAVAAEPAASPFARGNGETVLAVEDNPGLRRVVVRQLGELGYRVIEAEDAGAALAVLESRPVAVLFSDVVLPGGTSGYELARAALARWPHVKVVLTSGFPENRAADDERLQNLRLLSKPYRKEDLAQVIAGALEGDGGR
jgi:PAS domain S-box-containing protein